MHVRRRAGRGVRRRGTAALAALVCTALVAGACNDSGSSGDAAGDVAPAISPDASPAGWTTRTSVGQVTITGAEPGTDLLLASDGVEVDAGETDDAGALIFREVEPGTYRVATAPGGDDTSSGDDDTASSGEQEASEAVEVPSEEASLPEQAFYDGQVLEPGYTYIETRDGTRLAASVYLPGPVEDGPYPTVVEYSGYDPAEPGGNIAAENEEALAGLGLSEEQACSLLPFLCDTPAQPSSILALAMGYAVVAVNVRGTGCSGGAYDYFELLQVLDGYDVIETVAAQDWVKGNKVGMVGLSYPGISQLFVARSQPPSLAAITPLSVMDDTVRGLLSPGGMFNQGFALSWADQVLERAEPLGQGWEEPLIEAGDTVCEENQGLRGQNVDVTEVALQYDHYPPELGDWYNPTLFGEDIEVPIFLTGAFQDEQTGGRFPHLWGRFPNSPLVRFTMFNGAHADGYAPVNLTEWKTFLDLYVGDQIPSIPPAFGLVAPALLEEVFGAELTVGDVRLGDSPSVEAARAAYEAEKPVRLILESGAGDPDQPGAPVGTTTLELDQWPPADVEADAWYLGPDGTMTRDRPGEDGSAGSASRYEFDPEYAATNTLDSEDSDDVFTALPAYEWAPEPAGSAAVFLSEPLAEDLPLAGDASADLWIRSSAPQADIGVTLSEVRPDGQEVFIQAGVLRASNRAPGPDATDLWPAQTLYEEDDSPLPVDEFTEARVEIFPFAHVVRAGSRIRISVHTAGGDRPRWDYILADGQEGATVDVGHAAATPSALMLPLLPSLQGYPAELPPCPGLRGQPCREFRAYENTPAD